jgi:hypothetical protein
MKLGKLLAAGKSIMNGHAEISYRSSKQIYLPKFGASKNPFKSEAPTDAAEITSAVEAERLASGAANTAPSGVIVDTHAPIVNLAEPTPTVSENGPAVHGWVAPSNKPKNPAGTTELPQTGKNAVNSGPANPQSTVRNMPRCSPPQSGAQPQNALAASRHSEDESTLQRFNSLLRSALGKAGSPDKSVKNQKGTATQTELSLDSVKVVHNDLSDVDVEVVPIKSRSAATELPTPKKSWEYVGERLFGVEAT